MLAAQLETMCFCCSDQTHYKRKVNDVENKINITDRLLSQNIDQESYKEFKNRMKSQLFIIQNDRMHVHFMCGSCRKVNESELRLKEDQLRENLYKVFYLIYTTGDCEMYYETLRILQGDYSITYRCLEKLWYIRKKEA